MSDNKEELSLSSKRIIDKIWESIKQKPKLKDDIETWKDKNDRLSLKLKYWNQILKFSLLILAVIVLWRLAYCSYERGWMIKIIEDLIDDSNNLIKMFINIIPSSDSYKCAILCITLVAIIFIKNKFHKKDSNES